MHRSCPVGNQRGLVWHRLIEEELFLYVPADHRLADREAISLREAAGEPFISFKKGYGMRTLTDEFCAQAGFVPRIKFEGDDVATAAGLVSAGLGIALIPAFTGIDAGRIRRLRITGPRCRREIGLAWVEDRRLSPAAERFRSFIIEQFREQP
ncbi:LysR substrate-binding domain-containing protein [Paenibacillus sp. TAB 01]|uniref:LysR substrate-binding domain-containing protein n=1 Tax=Paenibacillus sp. TAB 01 TaxID=3368988 RepID=UPI0037534F26